MRQRDDRLRDRFVVLVVLQSVDEALIDLDPLNRQSREIRQARIAGAEVVDGDRDAHLLQLAKCRHRAFRVRDDDVLGDLEIEKVRRQPALHQRVLNGCEPVLVLQLLDREIDGEPQQHVLTMPLHDLATGIVQNALTERLNHSGFLGDGNEFRG